MCEYCENPNNTITSHPIGVSAFVGAGRLLLLNRIKCASELREKHKKVLAGNSKAMFAKAVKFDKELKEYGN